MAPVRPSPVAASTGVSGSSAMSVGGWRSRSVSAASSWPTIFFTISSRESSASGYSPTSLPLRRIVTRSAIA